MTAELFWQMFGELLPLLIHHYWEPACIISVIFACMNLADTRWVPLLWFKLGYGAWQVRWNPKKEKERHQDNKKEIHIGYCSFVNAFHQHYFYVCAFHWRSLTKDDEKYRKCTQPILRIKSYAQCLSSSFKENLYSSF